LLDSSSWPLQGFLHLNTGDQSIATPGSNRLWLDAKAFGQLDDCDFRSHGNQVLKRKRVTSSVALNRRFRVAQFTGAIPDGAKTLIPQRLLVVLPTGFVAGFLNLARLSFREFPVACIHRRVRTTLAFGVVYVDW
jgi:hypothetical protein